jgi:endonuclease G
MKNLLFLLLLIVPSILVAQYQPKYDGKYNEIVKHKYYELSYNEKHEQANWVYYKLTPEMVNNKVAERRNNFRSDHLVKTESAQLSDYSGSGYDRGHLCPAGDMGFNKEAMSESFLMSNMSPQKPVFNRGGWEKLESEFRNIAKSNTIYIVTGAILKDGLSTIGKNEVSVPEYYYKILYCAKLNKMIAYLIPNEKIDMGVNVYRVTVDSIESITGIDFYPQLQDEIENKLESVK